MITDDEILRMARQHGDCITVFGGDGYVFGEAGLCALVKEAIAAHDAQQWHPIETAPKNGRELILLLTPSKFPQIAYSNTWWTSGFSVECQPTHWMPLPSAPIPTETA